MEQGQVDYSKRPKGTEGESITNKRFLWCCCILAILLVVLAVIVAILFFDNINFSDIFNDSSDKPANLTPALFLNLNPPNYSITKAEKTKFDSTISESFSGSELKKVQEIFFELSKNYPEGYFVIVKMNLGKKNEFKEWYDLMDNTIMSPDIGLIIHETTHSGSNTEGCTYFVEDKCLKIQNEGFLYSKLFSGKRLLKYIDNPNDIDIKYLKEADQKLLTTLDEINAYIKSVRTDRAYKEYSTNPATLARQLYILTLHFKYAQNEDKEVWNALVVNKGLAYITMRLKVMAEAELEIARQEGFSNSEVTENLKLYQENKKYLDNYLEAAQVAKLENEQLKYDELLQRNVNFGMSRF